MDLFIGRGFKSSSTLIFTSNIKFFSKLPLLFNNRSRVVGLAYKQQNQYFGKYLNTSSCQSNHVTPLINQSNNKPFNHFVKNILLSNSNVAYHGTSSESKSIKTSLNKHSYEPPVVEKPSLFQRMKQMTKDYWHILIPVHIVTSIGWASMFYIAAKNGVDIVGILESLCLSEKYLELLRNSNAGHWAITYALYKIFTPLRYTVTLGGTTMSIRYLNRWGYLKSKKDTKLEQSIECAQEHMSSYGKPGLTKKNNQQQPPKT